MNDQDFLKELNEAIQRDSKKPYSQILEELRERGIVNEKGEVIVRMPIAPGPNAKKRKKKRSEES